MLTQEYLKSCIKYNPKTGVFVWIKCAAHGVKAGDVCGSQDGGGYLKIWMKGRKYYAHRLAWLYTHGEFPKNQIDHINGVRDDNRISNLRDVSGKQNMRNAPLASNNTSGHTGVRMDKRSGKWLARIKVNKKDIHLGAYSDINNAISARSKAEKDYGFHPNHGLTPEARRLR